jgi:hypothetical protein
MMVYTFQKTVHPTRLVDEIESALSITLHSEDGSPTDGHLETSKDSCSVVLKEVLSREDELILESVVEHHMAGNRSPERIVAEDTSFSTEKHLRMQQEPREGAEKYFYTHNLCDACTWYQGATEVTEAAATDSGDLTTWTTTHDNWIDLNHGRVFREDDIEDHDDYNILVEVSEDSGETWTPATENTWGQTDEDFTFDYEDGEVTFNAALSSGDQVRVSGYKANSSTYSMAPVSGKHIKLEYVEVQYTVDLQMDRDVVFEIMVYAAVAAEEDAEVAYAIQQGWLEPTDLVPAVTQKYKRIQNFYEESTGPFPVTDAHGGEVHMEEVTGITNIETKRNAGWKVVDTRHNGTDWIALMETRLGDRAMRADLITIPFQYLAYRDIKSSWGMEVRVHIDGHQPFAGQFATVTLYCTTEDE